MATIFAKHKIPLAIADELTHMVFRDSEIAKSYSSRRTKTACIINGAIAPFFQQCLVNGMKSGPFAICILVPTTQELRK